MLERTALRSAFCLTEAELSEAPPKHPMWLEIVKLSGGKTKFTGAVAEDIIETWFKGSGYKLDRYGGWLGAMTDSGQARYKLMATNIQKFKGSPGNWFKVSSEPKSAAAQRLVGLALKNTGQTDSFDKLKGAFQKDKAKKLERADNAKQKATTYRTALALVSADLSPSERNTIIAGQTGKLLPMLQDTLAQLEQEGRFEDRSKSILKVTAPPVFVTDSKDPWPTEFNFEDSYSKQNVRVWAPTRRDIGIEIGDLDVDPFAHQMRGISFSGTGAVGGIRSGKEPFLFMIMAREKQKGTGTRMVRQFCRIIHAYGFQTFVAEAIGPEGQAFLKALDAAGEINIIKEVGHHWLIGCSGAKEDPAQQLLFVPPRK